LQDSARGVWGMCYSPQKTGLWAMVKGESPSADKWAELAHALATRSVTVKGAAKDPRFRMPERNVKAQVWFAWLVSGVTNERRALEYRLRICTMLWRPAWSAFVSREPWRQRHEA
jgi:hypothetical protein